MSSEMLLYILILVARIAVGTYVLVKYGWKAFCWMFLYAVISVIPVSPR